MNSGRVRTPPMIPVSIPKRVPPKHAAAAKAKTLQL